jgi:hypothetical protein
MKSRSSSAKTTAMCAIALPIGVRVGRARRKPADLGCANIQSTVSQLI